ncbi:DsbE family thiol:disulfide interchange protein [Aliikangiella sp. G2MR2-5]|uniref:DsbE family thiol:disulfide interchange protein n=1 Tax=Aliikangiella sp. G2MR2-5 TaxID=2788943 RepID=UPI0018ABAD50|nr:DsbE family thiol:disulfide interchange protein [Aliikangiella sp. G2MR2-5]
MNNKTFVFLIPFLFFVAMAILLWTGLGKDPTKLDSQLIGKAIPVFSRSTLQDESVTITNDDIKGPALINVFASWCPSCYNEHPYLMTLSKSKEIKIYGLNYKDERSKGLKFINDLGNPYYQIIFDNSGRLGIDMGVYGAPETFLINDKNEIIYRHVGIVNQQVWEEILKPKIYPGELIHGGR